MKKIIICFALAFLTSFLFCQEFRFIQEEGSEYRIVSEVHEGVFLNDELLGESTILNRIGIVIGESDESGATLNVNYGISEQSVDSGLYLFSTEASVQFYRAHNGLYGDIPTDQYLPSVRDIPLFPEKSLAVGESWSAMAEEVHDLYPFFQIDYRLHIPFRVFYSYEGSDLYQGRPVDVINISYHFLYELDPFSLPPGSLPGGGIDLPVGVSGDFKQVYFWDREAGIPAAVNEEFRISYSMDSGNRYLFQGKAEGRVIEADQWEKNSVKEMIEEVIENGNIEDVGVSVSDDGVVLTLEDIHFYPDTADLLPGEEDKLRELARIIREFPEHDLLITGHTAFVGSHSTGQRLSEERAASVAAFFLESGVKSPSEMVIQGKGSREPIADNNTDEGRKRNRRVEITILDN